MRQYEMVLRSDEIESFKRAVKNHIKNQNILIRCSQEDERHVIDISTFNLGADKKLKEAFNLIPALAPWKNRLHQDNCQCGSGANCCKVTGVSTEKCACSES